jgi:hypothetical protein
LQSLVLKLSSASNEYAKVATALKAAARLAQFVNANAHDPQFWKDGPTAAKHITPVMHLLLCLPRFVEFNATTTTASEAVCIELVRLALLITLVRLKQAFSLISEELHALHERFWILSCTTPCADERYPELVLWAYVVVACKDDAHFRAVYVDAISRMSRNMGLRTGKDAVQCAKQFVWIEALMDPSVLGPDFELDLDLACHSFLVPQEPHRLSEPAARLDSAQTIGAVRDTITHNRY